VRKETYLKVVEEVSDMLMLAAEQWANEQAEFMADVKNPEKMIGKKYEDWTPEDLAWLGQAYQGSTILEGFIANKSIDEMLRLEAEA